MHIDWFTFFAQIVNFLVLVALLKRFLYRPITAAMARREELIAARLAEAGEREEDADRRSAQYEQRLKELDENRAQHLRAAEQAATDERHRMFESARNELEDARRQWRAELELEKSRFLTEIKRRTAGQVCAISRKALADLADAELERQVIRVFLRRLETLEADKLEALRAACPEGSRVTLCTSFEFPDELRDPARATLARTLTAEVEVGFARTEDWLCGVELEIPGERIVWTLDSYLEGFEERLDLALAEPRKA